MTGPFAGVVDADLQTLLLPRAVDLLLVHIAVLVVPQSGPGPPEPIDRVFGGVGAQPGPQFGVRLAGV